MINEPRTKTICIIQKFVSPRSYYKKRTKLEEIQDIFHGESP